MGGPQQARQKARRKQVVLKKYTSRPRIRLTKTVLEALKRKHAPPVVRGKPVAPPPKAKAKAGAPPPPKVKGAPTMTKSGISLAVLAKAKRVKRLFKRPLGYGLCTKRGKARMLRFISKEGKKRRLHEERKEWVKDVAAQLNIPVKKKWLRVRNPPYKWLVAKRDQLKQAEENAKKRAEQKRNRKAKFQRKKARRAMHRQKNGVAKGKAPKDPSSKPEAMETDAPKA